MYGHHGSKAAGNMIGHLLGYDLKERGVPIAMIHVRLESPFFLFNSTSLSHSSLHSLQLRQTHHEQELIVAWILED